MKKKLYELGTQEVIIPPKGDASDVIQPALSLAGTGASIGSAAGPYGTALGAAVGAVAGAGIGTAKLLTKNAANRKANQQKRDSEAYYNTFNRVDDPLLQSKAIQLAENGLVVNGDKPIEVERDELVFSKSPSGKFRLKADFKGGKTHNEGGEDYIASEGDIIFPGKDRKKILKAYKDKDHIKLETMRLSLPKDTDTDQYRRGTRSIDLPPLEYQNDPWNARIASSQPSGILGANAGANVGANPVSNNQISEANVSNGILEAAPTIYNTVKGLSKPVKTVRRQITFDPYQYQDLSEPLRRSARQTERVQIKNIRDNSSGNSSLFLANAAQAYANKYNRLSDIENNEIGRKIDVLNANTDLRNQAKNINLNLQNQYDDLDLRNIASGENMLAKASTGVSLLNQQRRMDNALRERDDMLPIETDNYVYDRVKRRYKFKSE